MEKQQKQNRMHNVIIVVMIATVCLSFQPQVVGKSSDNEFWNEKIKQNRGDTTKYIQPDQEFQSNHSSKIELPAYMHIHDEKYKWPLIDITPSLKAHRHLGNKHCAVDRFDDTKSLLKLQNLLK